VGVLQRKRNAAVKTVGVEVGKVGLGVSPRAREELVKILLRVAGEWGTSTVTLDQLLTGTADPLEVRAARIWKEGCRRTFIQLKKLHETGALIDPHRPEWKG